MQYLDALEALARWNPRFARRAQSKASPAARKEPEPADTASVDPDDAAGGGGPDRAVGLEVAVQRIAVIGADPRRDAALQNRKAVATDREKIIHRHPVARHRIDFLALQRHPLGDDVVAIWFGAVPGVVEAVRDLKNPRQFRVDPLLLEHVL